MRDISTAGTFWRNQSYSLYFSVNESRGCTNELRGQSKSIRPLISMPASIMTVHTLVCMYTHIDTEIYYVQTCTLVHTNTHISQKHTHTHTHHTNIHTHTYHTHTHTTHTHTNTHACMHIHTYHTHTQTHTHTHTHKLTTA